MNIQRRVGSFPLFASGFRLFFISAASLASVVIVYWVLLLLGEVPSVSLSYYPPLIWHMHEMVYGYIGAVIAGFLLTAVQNWTGLPTLSGWPLTILVFMWLLARCLPFLGPEFAWLIALLNFLFFIYLAIAIAIPIIRAGNNRNLFVVLILIILAMTNASLHVKLLGVVDGVAIENISVAVAFYLQLLLTIIIAGRVFPMFSANGLKGIYVPVQNRRLEVLCVCSFLVFALVSTFSQLGSGISPPIQLSISLLAVILHTYRVAGWFHWRIFTKPLIWVLHVGYYFIVAGILLVGMSAYSPEMWALGIHAMLVGGLGLITVGMMARVSLGHTGRDVHQPNSLISAVFVSITMAALVRVFLPIAGAEYYAVAITLSALLWGVGFMLFLILHVPILIARRIDGLEG